MDGWTGAGVSGAPDGKVSGADLEVSGVDPEASGTDLDGKVSGVGVPLTTTATGRMHICIPHFKGGRQLATHLQSLCSMGLPIAFLHRMTPSANWFFFARNTPTLLQGRTAGVWNYFHTIVSTLQYFIFILSYSICL
jgi:hypothetical protein